jgi:hypothetical protein
VAFRAAELPECHLTLSWGVKLNDAPPEGFLVKGESKVKAAMAFEKKSGGKTVASPWSYRKRSYDPVDRAEQAFTFSGIPLFS